MIKFVSLDLYVTRILTVIHALYERNSVTRARVAPGTGDDRDIR